MDRRSNITALQLCIVKVNVMTLTFAYSECYPL